MNSISLSLRFSQWPNTFLNTLNSRFLSPNTFPQIFSITKQKEILEREPGWNQSSPFHSFPCHSISPRNVSGATGLVGYNSDGSDNGGPDFGSSSSVGGFNIIFNDDTMKAILGEEVEAIGADADP